MSYGYTTKSLLPYPLADEYLKNVNDHIRNLTTVLDPKVVVRCADQTEVGTKFPAPAAGDLTWVVADKVLQIYDGTGWKRIYPFSPMIYSGTADPASSLGTTGDIYIKYS